MILEQKSSEKYIIHIDNFEGPLDLLWDLIKRSKIDIMEISLSHITEQYLAYLRLMEKLNIHIASEFILMASELLYYKSKAILPAADLEDEYFMPPLPPDLVEKLLEYKRFQIMSRKLVEGYDRQSNCFSRNGDSSIGDDVYLDLSLFDLLNAFVDVYDAARDVEEEEIVFDEILVSDRIDFINVLLRDQEYIFFHDIFTSQANRSEIVVSFLAILEMAKSGFIRLLQHTVFGDIRIQRA
jgi:segregation and condensation protein A